jgi:8-hydroxy-5-deazaflavin:NADPH oxidoreductase
MNIAIIGAGNVGTALATSFARAGHKVQISSSDHAHAEAVATSTGAHAAASNREAIQQAEVVVLAIPFTTLNALAAELGTALDGKIVVDATHARSRFARHVHVRRGAPPGKAAEGARRQGV